MKVTMTFLLGTKVERNNPKTLDGSYYLFISFYLCTRNPHGFPKYSEIVFAPSPIATCW